MLNTAQQIQHKSVIDNYDVSKFTRDVPNIGIKLKFELDDYQKRSIYRLSQDESVFVSVPTSGGKTIVAMYAISRALAKGKRAIYTSPIKSLSNQKFREFSNEFGIVGILTGDITIKRDAPILIMTTEILRSMLYKKDKILNNVDVVIFDEFHYIANQQRGCVWEESIIRMPNNINMAFLSASMPNAEEIANWISSTKNRNIYIEAHYERPVPLNHSIFLNDQILKIADGQNFNSGKLLFAQNFRVPRDTKSMSYLMSLIQSLKLEKLLPALIFEFSIKSIEDKTDMICNSISVNLLTSQEKIEVERFFNKLIKTFSKEDRELHQIKKMHELLIRGVGIHHSGIIPILKEAVEILLSKGLVKLVFCTSTIGMGLNLPVRTCVFTNITKFNSKEYVNLTPTEYQQMSGRAGRRGLDEFGTSILCISRKFPEISYLNNLFCGQPEEIKSQFQISFKIVINSLSDTCEMDIHEILRKSFLESTKNTGNSELNKKIENNKTFLAKMPRINECEHKLESINSSDIEDIECGSPIRTFVETYKNITYVNSQIVEDYLGEFEKALKIGMIVLYLDTKTFIVAMIRNIIYKNDSQKEIQKVSLVSINKGSYEITKDNFENLHLLSLPIAQNASELSQDEIQNTIKQFNMKDNLKKYSELIDIQSKKFNEFSISHDQLMEQIIDSHCLVCPSVISHYKISSMAEGIRTKIRRDEELLYKNELKEYECYLKTLKEMKYIRENNGKYSLEYKGKIANDIYGHEIISTELFNSKIFDDCEPEEIAALCSCLVSQRVGMKNTRVNSISPKMSEKMNTLYAIIHKIAEKMLKYSIPFNKSDFMSENFNPNVMFCTYLWASGASFSKIMQFADTILEGQMINVMTKICGMLTSFKEIGEDLEEKTLTPKFAEALKKVDRGIVAAKSLYIFLNEK